MQSVIAPPFSTPGPYDARADPPDIPVGRRCSTILGLRLPAQCFADQRIGTALLPFPQRLTVLEQHLAHGLEHVPSELEHSGQSLGIHLATAHHAHHAHHARRVHLAPHHPTHHGAHHAHHRHPHHLPAHHGRLPRRLLLLASLTTHWHLPAYDDGRSDEDQHQ